MKLLALETSTEYCSVALWRDGEVTEHFERVGQKHSEELLPMIEALLQATGHTLQALDGIAFGKGPGSFTGVRIACGVAQGLALGADVPVVGVCTLEALAEASGRDKVIAALDARMGELYLAAYEREAGGWRAVVEPCLRKAEDAPEVPGEGWFGIGSGFAHTLSPSRLRPPRCALPASGRGESGSAASGEGKMLVRRYAGQMSGVDAVAVPRAAAVAALGALRFMRGDGVDAAQALPLYLRDKVAFTTREREAR